MGRRPAGPSPGARPGAAAPQGQRRHVCPAARDVAALGARGRVRVGRCYAHRRMRGRGSAGGDVTGDGGIGGDPARLRALLRERDETRAWLEGLDRLARPAPGVALPSADALPAVLLQLAVPHEDIDALVALRPSPRWSPAVWWLLERCVQGVAAGLGVVGAPAGPAETPPLPEALGGLARYFYVYVFVAALPGVRAYHRARGVPAVVSRVTLSDLGRSMAVHRRRRGGAGWRSRSGCSGTSGGCSTSWAGCNSSAPGWAGAPGARSRRGAAVHHRRPGPGGARPGLLRAPGPGGVRRGADPRAGLLRPPLPGGALRGRHLPLLAAGRAARGVPAGGRQHRPVPAALPARVPARPRPVPRCPALRLRPRGPARPPRAHAGGAGRAAPADGAGAGGRGPPEGGPPWHGGAGWLRL